MPQRRLTARGAGGILSLMRACLLVVGLALAAPSGAVEFKVHTYQGVSEADYAQVVAGIELFARLAREQCSLELAPTVSRVRRSDPGQWGYSHGWQELPSPSGQPFSFHYYQAGMYQLTRRENLPQVAGRIDVFVRERWENCGTSFPVVQFFDEEARARAANAPLNRDVLPWVANRIMLVSRSGMGDCGDYTRVVAHEVGHLFVQDDPAHHCAVPSGRMVPCDASNLMAHTIENPREEFMFSLLANGTRLTPAQCARAARSLTTLWDPL
jgi:hypothetical protein